MHGGIHIQPQVRGTVGTFVERIYFGRSSAACVIGDGRRGGPQARLRVWLVWHIVANPADMT